MSRRRREDSGDRDREGEETPAHEGAFSKSEANDFSPDCAQMRPAAQWGQTAFAGYSS
jgi:hypothetical protein